jgi:hypothetical protein
MAVLSQRGDGRLRRTDKHHEFFRELVFEVPAER